jgi:hypothetical protein
MRGLRAFVPAGTIDRHPSPRAQTSRAGFNICFLREAGGPQGYSRGKPPEVRQSDLKMKKKTLKKGRLLPSFAGIRCPHCLSEGSAVVDSRDCVGRDARRRRHACTECGERFTTYEITADEYDQLRGVNIDRTTIVEAITALRAVQRALPK